MTAESNSPTLTPAKGTGAYLVLPAENFKNLDGIKSITVLIMDAYTVDVLIVNPSILRDSGSLEPVNGYIAIPIEKSKGISLTRSQAPGSPGNS
jgi:hypothetical protein